MKKILTLSLAVSAFMFSASAQEQREIKRDKATIERRQGMKDGKHKMQDLNLTEAQKTQMKALRDEYKIKLDELKAQNLSDAHLMERRKALYTEQKTKRDAILTAEQRSKLAERSRNFEGKRHGKTSKTKGNKGNHYGQMKSELSLTDAQASQLKAQRDNIKARKIAIKNDQSLSKEAKKEQMKALKTQAIAQRKTILTADQISKMEQLKKDRKEKGSKKARK